MPWLRKRNKWMYRLPSEAICLSCGQLVRLIQTGYEYGMSRIYVHWLCDEDMEFNCDFMDDGYQAHDKEEELSYISWIELDDPKKAKRINGVMVNAVELHWSKRRNKWNVPQALVDPLIEKNKWYLPENRRCPDSELLENHPANTKEKS